MEYTGPILDRKCTKVCNTCIKALDKCKIPKYALANGLWLKDLSFAERFLVSHMRHNRCLAKMTSNAIMFATPTVKVYKILPPILAILFTGSAQPTQDDFNCTPMLVQRNKLNHADYSDLEISNKNLESYPLKDVSVLVDYCHITNGINPAAMAMHDDIEDSIHGLTGTEYSSLSLQALKAKAFQHLESKGKMLGIGHKEIFPWLFPYGFGGIGQQKLQGIVSEEAHKKHLLLYHNKQFQMDFYFPMISFNLDQPKAGMTRKISERLCSHVKPVTEDQKRCFAILNDLDHVGGHVKGSIWSLISFKGVPSWFITLSSADNRHPIYLYFANQDIEFKPEIRMSDDQYRLISQNSVAVARFFDFLVKAFILHVLSIGSNHPGLYGETDAYYGTVEQQDSEFQKALIAYLEGCYNGEFLTRSMDEIKAKVPHVNSKPKGIHTITSTQNKRLSVPMGYLDPTKTLPLPPPHKCNCQQDSCNACKCLNLWWDKFNETTDNLILKSNKGCINKDGVCTARFPWEIHEESSVDLDDGYIKVKKLEPLINTLMPALTYLFRCNTDVSSMLSGTAIKAVVSYLTDYISKPGLKTHQIFSTAFNVFEKNPNLVQKDCKEKHAACRLILKIVNTLSTKLEIGSPMALLYLLGNPDHYKSHQFVIFWWKSYVSEVLNSWENDLNIDEEGENMEVDVNEFSGVGPNKLAPKDKILIGKEKGKCVEHPLYEMHCVTYKQNKTAINVSNFVGGSLPLSDHRDCEYYCCTMLTLFCPWRSGKDLKLGSKSWDNAFVNFSFKPRDKNLMKNFNL
ncbi:hypothetical protein BDQ12DRAFT_701429 [Crucibulum laeve]|uniref:Uncharacterized protein n=1 Tax=Crucibulum laeve TaxID=68775 RepID=A0A5C3LI07_9AGAR|nr:hypothetical protein BDQ12DRAFT_701429 [Crucibulum laeve]